MEIKNIVNLKDYPIDQTGSKEYQDLITKNRELLDKDGCCVLSNFVLSESLKRMKEEVERNLPKTLIGLKIITILIFQKMMKI